MSQRFPLNRRTNLFCSAIFLVAPLVVPTNVTAFQDAKQKPKETKPAEKPAADDPFAVPEGDADELLAFIEKVSRMRPRFRTIQDVRKHLTKANAAVGKAVEEILADKKADDKTVATAIGSRFALLSRSKRFVQTAAKTTEALVKSLETDKRPAVIAIVAKQKLIVRVGNVTSLTNAKQEKLIDDVDHWLAKGKLERSHLAVAVPLARALENAGKTDLAVDAYTRFAARFKQADDPKLVAYSKRLEGSVRRVQLPGNTMEVFGKTLAGEKFDWSKYKGKVVLVDFWATWCGPCIAELPNVKKNYDLYHERGFDVVGISLDTQSAKVESFLEKHEIAWATLFSEDPDATGWAHPLAAHYGISSIPNVILVDRDGKVVSLRARGPELGRLLEKLIGPPEVAAKDSEPQETKDDKKTKGETE